MKKNLLFMGLSSVAACSIAMGVMFALNKGGQALTRATNDEQWVHYARRDATPSQLGIREYWVQCGGAYQFTAPEGQTPVDAVDYDTSEFAEFDDRYFTYAMDEHYHDLTVSNFGARMYSVDKSDFKDFRATYEADAAKFNLYSEGDGFFTWRIDLPRIDYTKYPTVTMKVAAPNWYEQNMMGPEADQLTYHTNWGGNKDKGEIHLALGPAGLHMDFIDIEYGTSVAFEKTFTDSDIIHGLKSAYFYTQDKWDRYLNLSDFVLSKEASKVTVMHFGGDTAKLSVVNGSVGLPGSVDYSIISNAYASNETGLVVSGNANPGTMEATFPAVNFNSFLASGVITTKFGVKNNNEEMFWGSSAVSLGKNSPSSQSENNNGYVNWELTIMDGLAYVHNIYENKNFMVSLTAGMMNGTEGIVLSGGGTSIYRVYLFTDFYWQLTPTYPLVAPASPQDIYSYAQDKTKISVVNGAVTLAGSADYSIINNSYATNDTCLVVQGNANPGAMVATLPAINFKPYAEVGKVTFKFGVANNGEHMYWGSGDSKIDLGANSSTSQAENNNGYVNWEMVITADGAYVHNVNSGENINVPLTAGMRAGTESIVLSGGNTSVYRNYLFVDFYWSAL